MFTSRFAHICFVVFIFFTWGSPVCVAQEGGEDWDRKEKVAVGNFESGNYPAAISDLQSLLNQFPDNPLYRYYLGACLVHLNQDLDRAVELLQYSSKRDVPVDVYYYLGEAHRKNYDFKQAKKSFIKFDKEASRSQAREQDPKLLIRSADHAVELTSAYNPTRVLNMHFIDFTNPEEYGQLQGKGGKLARKPIEFFRQQEGRDDLNALMFMPEKISRGQYVYFSGLQGRDGFQIMQAKRGNTGKWIDITPVDVLNTAGDEILPYFDPVSKDLYFASNGRSGLGGFDLFRSHFDGENKSWSEPVNLGFPVNSVYDDYIAIPGADLGMIMLVTARHSKDSAFAAYRLHIIEPRQTLSSAKPDEIKKIAGLGYEAGEVPGNFLAGKSENHAPHKPNAETDHESVATPESSSGQLVEAEPVSPSELASGEGPEDINTHQQLIQSALKHQRMADSLEELTSKAMIKVRKIEDPDERWVHQKQIIIWRKRTAEEKALADQLFTEVASHEKQLYPSTITPDTVINELVVYKYTLADSINSKARKAFANNNEPSLASGPSDRTPGDQAIVPAVMQNNQKRNEDAVDIPSSETGFAILETPLYDESSPIPGIDVPSLGPSYRIQLAVLSKRADNEQFGGFAPLGYELIEDRDLYRYYAGSFFKFADAEKALKLIRKNGYADAYIVGWFDGRKMSYEKVRKLEK